MASAFLLIAKNFQHRLRDESAGVRRRLLGERRGGVVIDSEPVHHSVARKGEDLDPSRWRFR